MSNIIIFSGSDVYPKELMVGMIKNIKDELESKIRNGEAGAWDYVVIHRLPELQDCSIGIAEDEK